MRLTCSQIAPKEAAKATADESRPIPRYNIQAESPDEVGSGCYSLYRLMFTFEARSMLCMTLSQRASSTQCR